MPLTRHIRLVRSRSSAPISLNRSSGTATAKSTRHRFSGMDDTDAHRYGSTDKTTGNQKFLVARPVRFELTTPCSGGMYSIHLSYGRAEETSVDLL